MFRFLKSLLVVLLAVGGLLSAEAFSFWGLRETYQTPVNGYDRVTTIDYPSGAWIIFSNPEAPHAPKNLGEEYRWNVPNLYYAYDPSFLDYFGSNGVVAVDGAAALVNTVSNVDSFSPDLSEFPLSEARFNLTAQALHLFDLKSAAYEMLVTRLGLADPDRWTWAIRDKIPIPSTQCPIADFIIIQRNFDPLTWAPSSYVNGNLFTYFIDVACPSFRADAIERVVDPLADYDTAVATPKISFPNPTYFGMFHTGLTRDDAAGLRYLYSSTNRNEEISPPDALQFETNFVSTNLFGSNLTLFALQALTNDAAGLLALYPGLVIASSTNVYTNIFTTNVTAFITNAPPWAPAGTFVIAFTTNITITPQVYHSYTFGNLVSFQFINGQWVAVPVTSLNEVSTHYITATRTTQVIITNQPFAPAGTFQIITNSTIRYHVATGPVGEFFILPTNWCDVAIVAPVFTNVFTVTNDVQTATNTATTNIFGALSAEVATVSFFTNHVFVVFPVNCTNSTVDIRDGIGKISIIRHDYDPLFSRFFTPLTNDYVMTVWRTNNSPLGRRIEQRFRRIITRPDIVFGAEDLQGTASPRIETVSHAGTSFPNTVLDPGVSNNPTINIAGPGVFQGPMTLTFNKVGPAHLNSYPGQNDEATSFFYYQWASFDGSTNAPILYPNATSILNLQNQLYFVVSPTSLPEGTVGTNYIANLSVTGGQPPFTWSLSTNSILPDGLALTQNPTNSAQATISGTPVAAGVTPVGIHVEDDSGLSLDTFYVITINSP